MNESTALKCNERLRKFEAFVSERYGLRIDEIIKLIMKGKIGAYDALGNYILYLREKSNFPNYIEKLRHNHKELS